MAPVYQIDNAACVIKPCASVRLRRKVTQTALPSALLTALSRGTTLKILCVSQNKGGVGKTSLVKLIAVGMAMRGLRVLALDLDAQCNLSKRFLVMERDPSAPDGASPPTHPDYNPAEDVEWNGISSTADIYTGRLVVPYPTDVKNLDLLPGNGPELREVELVSRAEVVERVHGTLREFLRKPEVAELYDLVVIDTPPSKGPLVLSAMRAATHVVVPTQMEPNSVEGLEGMFAMWMQESRYREADDAIDLVGILPNMVRNVALHVGVKDSLLKDRSLGPMMLPVQLGHRTAFAETDHDSARPGSVFQLPARNPARREAEEVVAKIAERMGVAA
jgi:chromosome partitioning protein